MLCLQHIYNIFTTNYRWLVVIGSNFKLTLRLLFCPNNNNLPLRICCKNVIYISFLFYLYQFYNLSLIWWIHILLSMDIGQKSNHVNCWYIKERQKIDFSSTPRKSKLSLIRIWRQILKILHIDQIHLTIFQIKSN